jgi:phosphatidylglycerol lysyltransferase
MSSIGSQDRARELVLRYGWNATAYQIVNPGIRQWFSRSGDAVVGYVARWGVRVVAGAPVCAAERLADVAAEFESDAAGHGERVCYFCAEARLESLYRDTEDHSMVLLGSQPVWNPQQWTETVEAKKSLRAQLNRARNKGVAVEEWPPERAQNNVELHRCLAEWLSTRGLPPLHFLVEPETLSRLADRRTFIAVRDGVVVGFLIASPVPERRGWLVEQNIRGHNAPNGTTELLLDAAVKTLAAEGAEYLTLGLAPLSNRAGAPAVENPFWLRTLLGRVRAHGRRFYNFEGLEAFKTKFQPETWEPVYAIANERTFSILTLYAVASAFSDGSPVALLLRAMCKAAGTEFRWLLEKMKRGHRRDATS